MVEIEINGTLLTVPAGSTIMDAANAVGAYIPHFCYHKKLSIAANCRMCLVEVAQAPKPVPACATPVTEGLKVFTHSRIALQAQKGVMEFLLINHPLDCPICDQGGECQLQDLAVGYGRSESRYIEDKRSVTNKELGPLISTDMTRCIHCTRCIRFTEEIAGHQELGAAGRGEHTEITSFIGKTVHTEISGNVIDLCPVGALTSKPFRYSARNWELSSRKSISPHDGLGTHLTLQVKQRAVMRVLPRENEAINECWIADRDRFSYEALNDKTRLVFPMIKQADQWHKIDWNTALQYIADKLRQQVFENNAASAVSVLASPNSTLEELFLLQKLMHQLGIHQVDTRLRYSNFSLDIHKQGADWLGQSIVELMQNKAVLLVGSTLRKEQPLLAQRFRQAVKQGMGLNIIHAAENDLLMPVAGELIVRPDQLIEGLSQILLAICQKTEQPLPNHINLSGISAGKEAQQIADNLINAQHNASILLGNVAVLHPQAAELRVIAQAISACIGGKLGILSMAANTVGAELLGLRGGDLLAKKSKLYIFINLDPVLDSYDAQRTRAALTEAETVVVFSTHHSESLQRYADILIPIAPFSETAGTFINMEGIAQHFNSAVPPQGDARPAWKVFRVLANILDLAGFDYDNIESVRQHIFHDDFGSHLNVNCNPMPVKVTAANHNMIIRLGEIPIYQLDNLCRNAPSLQKTEEALSVQQAYANQQLLLNFALQEGEIVRLRQGEGEVLLPIVQDNRLADNVIRVAASTAITSNLAGMFEPIVIEKV